jgi:hypothetical protein
MVVQLITTTQYSHSSCFIKCSKYEKMSSQNLQETCLCNCVYHILWTFFQQTQRAKMISQLATGAPDILPNTVI